MLDNYSINASPARAFMLLHAENNLCKYAVMQQTDSTTKSEIAKWMLTVMASKGWTPPDWHKASGVAASTIQRALNPDYEFVTTTGTLSKLARAAGVSLPSFGAQQSDSHIAQGKSAVDATKSRLENKDSINGALQLPSISHSVPVVGYVEAGAWREMNDNDEVLEFVPFHAPEYAHLKLSGWRVSGQSVNKFYPPESSVIGLSPHDIPLRKGSFVIVKRTRADTAEITLKQFEVTATGQWQFWPRSTDARYQIPFTPPPRDELAQEGWEILAIIVGESKKVPQTGDIVEFDQLPVKLADAS